MPSVREQFNDAVKVLERYAPRRGYRSFVGERDLIILWGRYSGWSMVATARIAHCSRHTVKTVLQRYTDRPYRLFGHPVLRRRIRANGKVWWACEFCGDEMKGSERKAREHVASHVLPGWVIKMNGVIPRSEGDVMV